MFLLPSMPAVLLSSDCNEYSQPKASLVKGRGTAITVEGLRFLRDGGINPSGRSGHLPFTREAFGSLFEQ